MTRMRCQHQWQESKTNEARSSENLCSFPPMKWGHATKSNKKTLGWVGVLQPAMMIFHWSKISVRQIKTRTGILFENKKDLYNFSAQSDFLDPQTKRNVKCVQIRCEICPVIAVSCVLVGWARNVSRKLETLERSRNSLHAQISQDICPLVGIWGMSMMTMEAGDTWEQ